MIPSDKASYCILDAVRAGVKTAVRLYEAPAELDAVQKEIDVFDHVLRETVAISSVNPNAGDVLKPTIPTTRGCLLQIQQIIQYELIRDAPDGAKARHIAWLRKADRIRELQEKLSRCKSTLLLAFNCETLVTVRRSEAQLQEFQRTLQHQTADINQSLLAYRQHQTLALEDIKSAAQRRTRTKIALLIEGFKQQGQLEWHGRGKERLPPNATNSQLRLPESSFDMPSSSQTTTSPWDAEQILKRTVRRSPRESTFNLLGDFSRRQLLACARCHCECTEKSGHESQQLPKRVIYIGTGTDDVRLHETRAGETGKYASLSYAWGNAAPIVTTRSSLQARRQNIAWEVLPALIQDSITFLRTLDIAFLWVDSLCILQDDSKDWSQEAGKMRDIYGNCTFVLVSVSGPDPSHGLLPSEDRRSMLLDSDEPNHNLPSSDLSRYSGSVDELMRMQLRDTDARGVWNRRAWTLQEDLLSPRALYFDRGTVNFRCRTSRASCSIHNSVLGSPTSITDSTEQDQVVRQLGNEISKDERLPPNVWSSIVDEYSTRQLSFLMDKLIAISGVAQLVAEKTKDSYLAGHWSSNFVSSLGWHVASTERGADDYIAPSWSWASCSDRVSSVDVTNIIPLAELVRHDIVHMTKGHELGAIKSGSITLRGLCVDAALEEAEVLPYELEADKPSNLLDSSHSGNTHSTNDLVEHSLDNDGAIQLLIRLCRGKLQLSAEVDNLEDFAQGMTVTCLRISADRNGGVWTALVLVRSDGADRQTYRRIAVLDLYRRRGEHRWFEGAEEREIMII